MTGSIVYAHYNGTIKLIHAFQEQAGLPSHKQAVNAILFLNQAMVNDARAGLVYCVSERVESYLRLPEIYQSHAACARECRDRDIIQPVYGVDPVALSAIADYLTKAGVAPKNAAEVLRVATTVASVMYENFGRGKEGALHIPAIYPERPCQVGYGHIYLKMS